MAAKAQVVPISKLLLDQSNARLGQVQPDQDSTVVALANKIGTQLLELAQDIVNFSLDPTTLMAITPEGAPPGKFRVIEGNRRLLTLKALKNPKILSNADLTPGNMKRLGALSESFRKDPIRSVSSVVFDTEQEAFHWIDLRHTGANQGVGLVEWDSNEKDRYRSRHSGPSGRSPGGQVLDFVEKMLPAGSTSGKQRILTTLQRLIADPDVRTDLGLSLSSKNLYSHYPADEVIKGLSRVVSDLRSEVIKVTDVYHKGDRVKYIQRFDPSDLPNPSKQLPEPVLLTELSATSSDPPVLTSEATGSLLSSDQEAASIPGAVSTEFIGGPNDPTADTQRDAGESRGIDAPTAAPSGAPRSRVKPPSPRRTIIPAGCYLWIPDGRLNAIYNELRGLDVEAFPNGGAVLLRVFFELSVDYHLDLNSIMPEQHRLTAKLTKKIKDLADHLYSQGSISERIRRTAVKIADGTLLGVSVNSMNQYVHNTHTYPSSTELRSSWDEMQPIMAALWVKP